ncbi:MAG: hypothetical protein ACLUBL_03010 [Fusobacterium sp.]|uniref:hypothetical protein n=1 Tax=Fusobacterium sp. TaxID=68766 RepID=UPI003993AC8C
MQDRAFNRARNNYTQINNDILRNNELSWGAKGLLSYMLSRPDNWNFNMKEIASNSCESYGMTQKYMKELIEKKYVLRKRVGVKGSRGKFQNLFYFNDVPFTEEEIQELLPTNNLEKIQSEENSQLENCFTTSHFYSDSKLQSQLNTTTVINNDCKTGSYNNTENNTNTEKDNNTEIKERIEHEKIEPKKEKANETSNPGAYYQTVRMLLACFPSIVPETISKLGKPIERIKEVIAFAKKYNKGEGWIFSAIKYDYSLDSSYFDRQAEKKEKIQAWKDKKTEEEKKWEEKLFDFV